ncbi:MAG: heparin lyase I family protein [Microvirga sp.]
MTYLPSQWTPNSYDKDSFTLDGVNWTVGSEYSHSFDSPDNKTFRFEVRDGDQLSTPSYSDPKGTERSEMGEVNRHSLSGDGRHFVGEYKFMVEPGPVNTASWLVIGQLHSGLSRTPPFEIKLSGDKMMVVGKYDTGNGSPISQTLFKDTHNIKRGQWYTMKIDVQLDPKGNGHAHVWRDGVEIVDFNGKIGYTDSPTSHWRMGIYRDSPAAGETIAVQYKDIDLTYGSSGHSDTPGFSPSPSPSPSPTPEPSASPSPVPAPTPSGAINGTSVNDVLTGTSAGEYINGLSSADTLNGKGGKDVLTGGAGNDTFVFNTALSKTGNVDTITDFNVTADTLHLDNAVFTEVGSWGPMASTAFWIGTEAHDADDRIIYNSATGDLSYDPDGSGSASAVQFAKLATNLKMTAADFYVL